VLLTRFFTANHKLPVLACNAWRWPTTPTSGWLPFPIGTRYLVLVQTTQKTIPTSPLFSCVESLPQKRIYCAVGLAVVASTHSTILASSSHVKYWLSNQWHITAKSSFSYSFQCLFRWLPSIKHPLTSNNSCHFQLSTTNFYELYTWQKLCSTLF
jgi:hypothetical protein